jgi:glucose/arabinose dehydrogenase
MFFNMKNLLLKNLFSLLLVAIPALLNAQNKTKPDTLPAPYSTKSSNNFCEVVSWKNARPTPPAGFTAEIYSDGFENPRWMYVTPNGDVLVAESNSNYNLAEQVGAVAIGAAKSKDIKHSADRITLLRDVDKDGKPDIKEIFLQGLNQPFGMLIIGKWLYVANTNAVIRFPYKAGDIKITSPFEKLVDLPAGEHNRHWARNIISNADNSKIYIAVGSGSDHAEYGIENELLRGNILEMNPDGSDLKVYASGLRNPVGMGWAPGTKDLWVAVNERDELGDNLVPDYLTGVIPGGFYGWPYSYYGQHEDTRVKETRPELVKKAIVPDVDLGSHTASLGLAFYTGKSFPEKYHNGAFIAQHGSWNRSVLSGYKVIFVPFSKGKPSGKPEDFLTGFISDLEKNEVHGRPVGLAVLPDGSLLVTDDVTNIIWRVSFKK